MQKAWNVPGQEHEEEARTHEMIPKSAEKDQLQVLPPQSINAKEEMEESHERRLQLDRERREVALAKYNELRTEFFPEVPDISGEELLDLFSKNAVGDTVILVDCRSEAERQVSVYKGSLAIADFEANIDRYKEKEIVAYCAIGRRSGVFLKKLLARYPGIRVRNHAGSVVDWAHVGGPFVDEKTGAPTNRIHPNVTWAPYLPLMRSLQVAN